MIDYNFVQLMFTKYSKHLQDVVTSIETMIREYDRQLESLAKLDQKKYGYRVRELEFKKAEAYEKLSKVCPNIDKMTEQLNEIQSLIVADTK
jgi:hypothetical protein